MRTINMIGLLYVILVFAIGAGIKYRTKKRLNEIDGVGTIHRKEEDEENRLWI